jgi:hypothetical protein
VDIFGHYLAVLYVYYSFSDFSSKFTTDSMLEVGKLDYYKCARAWEICDKYVIVTFKRILDRNPIETSE